MSSPLRHASRLSAPLLISMSVILLIAGRLVVNPARSPVASADSPQPAILDDPADGPSGQLSALL